MTILRPIVVHHDLVKASEQWNAQPTDDNFHKLQQARARQTQSVRFGSAIAFVVLAAPTVAIFALIGWHRKKTGGRTVREKVSGTNGTVASGS